MEYRRLGRTDMTVSAISFGAWNSFAYKIPCQARFPLKNIGIFLFTGSPTTTTFYVDQVTASAGSGATAAQAPEHVKLTPLEENR